MKRYLTLLVVSMAFCSSACMTMLEGQGEKSCGDRCDQSVGYSPDDPWGDELVSIVDEEYQRLSTYASTDGGWGACVSTWTVGGAVLGEAASKTCVVVGVAAFETGVGAAAAAVCAGADFVQADALLGAAAGYVSGYVACSAAARFPTFLSGFRIFNISSETDTGTETETEEVGDEPQRCDTDEVASWNTQECKDLYCAYKDLDTQVRSCSGSGQTCEEMNNNVRNALRVADMREQHMASCPTRPGHYNEEGHQTAIEQLNNLVWNCATPEKLCNLTCWAEIPIWENDEFNLICGEIQ